MVRELPEAPARGGEALHPIWLHQPGRRERLAHTRSLRRLRLVSTSRRLRRASRRRSALLSTGRSRHGRLIKKNKGYVDKLFIAQLEPRLKDELERRMYAARELLEGDKKVALERIHQRFLGIATAGAQPQGGEENVRAITKAERDAKAHARMMAVDQTSKLMNMMDEVIAKDAGSIGGFWDATWDIERKHRPEHAARHDKWYPRRASWADDQGLLKRGIGWMDEHDMPGVLINCRCEYHYVYDLEDVPQEFLTPAGKAAA